jgi:probable F420-dependent oxidoreductase
VTRTFAQRLEQAGFDYVTLGGHVLSAEPGRFEDRPTPTYAGPFHDPFVLFSQLAAITERLEFFTSILILPLHPTALVAKQAAALDWLSGGRFRLGVGVSWNAAEYEALGQDPTIRGRRLEEQVTVLRRLWTEPFVTFKGRWHTLDRVGLNRLPAAPIPIWLGTGTDERVLRRVARLADGWIPTGATAEDPAEAAGRLRQYLVEADRDPATFGLMARLTAGAVGPAAWQETAGRLQALGVTHVTVAAPADLSPEVALERLIEAQQAIT